MKYVQKWLMSLLSKSLKSQCTICYILLCCCFRDCGSRYPDGSRFHQRGPLMILASRETERGWNHRLQTCGVKPLKFGVVFFFFTDIQTVQLWVISAVNSSCQRLLTKHLQCQWAEFSDGWMVPPKGDSLMFALQGRSVREAQVGLQIDCKGFRRKLLEYIYFYYSVIIDTLDNYKILQHDKG